MLTLMLVLCAVVYVILPGILLAGDKIPAVTKGARARQRQTRLDRSYARTKRLLEEAAADHADAMKYKRNDHRNQVNQWMREFRRACPFELGVDEPYFLEEVAQKEREELVSYNERRRAYARLQRRVVISGELVVIKDGYGLDDYQIIKPPAALEA